MSVGRLLSRPVHPVTGKRIIIRAHTQRELNAYLHRVHQIRQEVRLGIGDAGDVGRTLRGLERKRVTLLEAADSYASLNRLAPSTRALARNVVRDNGVQRRGRPVRGALLELAGERLEALTAPRVAKHFRALGERLAWASIVSTWRQLRAIVRHAAEQGWITAAPWGMWRPARPTQARPGRERRDCCRNVDERGRLLAEAVDVAAERKRPRFALAVVVALFTGARKGELAGLKWNDLAPFLSADRLYRGIPCTLTLARQYDERTLKEGKPRVVDLEDYAVARIVHDFEALGARFRDPMFPAASGGHMKQGDVIDVELLRLAVARAGLGDPKRWSPHSLRDSFVTIEAQACGGDLRRLAERTGHRSIDSLLRYLQTFERNPRAQAPALPAPRT